MKRLLYKLGVATAAATLAATALVATPAQAAGHGEGWYGVWASNVNVRQDSSEQCYDAPAPWACPNILTKVSAPQQVYIVCQKAGETVGGNPYWVMVRANGVQGWMASYYTNNATNWIDGLDIC
ncbi:hypothetical protein [Micromonospora sp. NPDC005413]|uniref:hypothetical protein n=1 Tax=Micromonospora sp. NPDC005413 TaxID=3154563 RepID=UPI0033B6080B